MEEFVQGIYEGERALFNIHNVKIIDGTFQNGESPLKECSDLVIEGTFFKWKYPMWYSKNIEVNDSILLDTARSGIWYTDNITMNKCFIQAPKTFRRSSFITLKDCSMPNALESFWNCHDINIKNTSAKGDYMFMNSENIVLDGFNLDGNYALDGAKNIVVKNSKLLSKDSFWNTKNVVVEDSLIVGEYIGWNSKNLTFKNCIIESTQGFCYIDNLKLDNCKLLNTDLSFERCSSIDAFVTSKITSVKNPYSGRIIAKGYGEIILDKEIVDPSKTIIEEN